VEPVQCIAAMARLVVWPSPIAMMMVPVIVMMMVVMVAIVVAIVSMMMVPVIPVVRLLHETTVDTGIAHRQ
jgi:hypothetical protein